MSSAQNELARVTDFNFMFTTPPWTRVYGVARSVLAFGTLLTLIFNSTTTLFKYSTLPSEVVCDPFSIGLFCIFDLSIAKGISIVILLVVISGWRPMITCIFHWWVSYSLVNSATMLDGGDHITAIITFLLIPLGLTDTRKSHWSTSNPINSSLLKEVFSIIGWSSLLMVKIQVAVIYLNSAVSKIFVPEWSDGTAIYYWLINPIFGGPSWLEWLIYPLIENRYAVFIITWGVIIFELFIFSGLISHKTTRRLLFLMAITFHFSILIMHGLVSFFFAMVGSLMIYLLPINSFAKQVKPSPAIT